VTTLERERGIIVGSLYFIVLLESARGYGHPDYHHRQPRITQVGLDETDLADDLGFTLCLSTTRLFTPEAASPSKRPLPK